MSHFAPPRASADDDVIPLAHAPPSDVEAALTGAAPRVLTVAEALAAHATAGAECSEAGAPAHAALVYESELALRRSMQAPDVRCAAILPLDAVRRPVVADGCCPPRCGGLDCVMARDGILWAGCFRAPSLPPGTPFAAAAAAADHVSSLNAACARTGVTMPPATFEVASFRCQRTSGAWRSPWGGVPATPAGVAAMVLYFGGLGLVFAAPLVALFLVTTMSAKPEPSRTPGVPTSGHSNVIFTMIGLTVAGGVLLLVSAAILISSTLRILKAYTEANAAALAPLRAELADFVNSRAGGVLEDGGLRASLAVADVRGPCDPVDRLRALNIFVVFTGVGGAPPAGALSAAEVADPLRSEARRRRAVATFLVFVGVYFTVSALIILL